MEQRGSFKFNECLENRKIIKEHFDTNAVLLELESAELDLRSAKKSIENKDYKWATVQGYYAMFRAARALIFSKGFREKSHNCGIIALEELFENELGYKYIEYLKEAKILREKADYESSYSEYNAKDILENAEEFIEKVRKILETKL